MVVFSVIYILLLFAYFITRVGNNMKYRAVNKYILATMYMVYAIIMFLTRNLSVYHYVLMSALVFAYLGDIFLVFDFSKGGTFFLSANICFFAFYLISLIKYSVSFWYCFWIFFVLVIIVGGFIALAQKFPNVLKLGSMKYPMSLYLASITLHGLFGLVSAIFIGTTPIIVMGIGSILFMISDYILIVDRFVFQKNKWIIRGNSLTYFTGLLLIVLSLGL